MKEKYFDNAATTKLDEEVLKKMMPFLKDNYGNPSSIYKIGKESKKAIDEAREKIAKVLNCDVDEVYFTKLLMETIGAEPIKQYIFTGTNKGDISILDLGNPGKEKLIKEISYFGGNLEIRILRYNPENHELYSGDQKGKITVWSLRTGQSIYAWQAHSGAITQMRYDRKKRQLLSVGKDKKIIFWQIPNSWVSESMKKFEEDNMREINASRAAAKFQKIKKEKDDDDSSEDSLDGWDIRP